MTATTPAASTNGAPNWPQCEHDADPSGNLVGCGGRRVDPYAECLAHLSDADRSSYLASLQPGADLDHRGTRFTRELLIELLRALVVGDPGQRKPRLGTSRFEEAVFNDGVFPLAEFCGDAWFSRAEFRGTANFEDAEFRTLARFNDAEFTGPARFQDAVFRGEARFDRATFGDDTWFRHTKFCGEAKFTLVTFHAIAWFDRTKFSSHATFISAKFTGSAIFDDAKFGDHAFFDHVTFGDDADFNGTEFRDNAWFRRAVFDRAAHLGPLTCERALDLSGAVFGTAVTIEAAAAVLLCQRTRWTSTAALRLRYAAVDLSDAVVEYPVSIAARSQPITIGGEDMAESGLTDARVRVTSLRGVDAVHLVLTDVDLTDCLFAGTIHLDQLRMEGRCPLARAPSGVRRRGWLPTRWTPRRTLAEEQHWRAARGTAADGWTPAPEGERALTPAALAPVYRQLRKAFEDGKDEPGAADFYYGEMEMRRHDHSTPRAERALLAAYWAVSGYGLRASRALSWLLLAMGITVLLMMLWGLPQDAPKPQSTGTLTGRSIMMTTDTPDPVNPDGPYAERLSTERCEKSLRVVINSVIFRSSSQDLTTVGTYTEMASRLTEPVLLGLAFLAIRGRVKR
ncbi:pentapeptide repeat-containing protein [Streptomyces sp. NPDC046862]|uniref:pentapeptide repeat-containing protein n=1 Tax=Streptomyces sp. NPDC046862 TaxID=3154603 RepID=UPI00345689CA